MPAKRSGKPAPSSKSPEPSAASERGLFGGLNPEDLKKIAPHVINLRGGKFIESGDFATTPADVDAIFARHIPASKKKKLLIWAHGGLVSEEDALQHVIDHHAGWLEAGIYPVYFVWETGFWTVLRDLIRGTPGERGLGDWLVERSDGLLEDTLHFPGVKVWGRMKEYAKLASADDGGARYAARRLADFVKAHPDVEIYACGHSAGSIFHSWFLPAVIGEGVKIQDLFLLAPAITTGDFWSRLSDHIGPGKGIARSTLFTMNETAELGDNCFRVYRKSLLYFVSRSFEPEQPTPILGLDESIRSYPAFRQLFGVDGPSASGEVIWSPNGKTDGMSASNSTTHGGFDNDYTTLNSMVRRITGKADLSVFEREEERAFAPEPLPAAAAIRTARPPRKRALCIGIDDYPAAPLTGCVADAKEWRTLFKSQEFETSLLTNGQGTRQGIIRGITDLLDDSRPGDVLALQFACHGTHVVDVDGDEEDGQDEAIVPFDYESGNFLIDDDLGELLDRVPDGVNLTCFMDCCHSATNTRLFVARAVREAGERVRFLPIPPDIMDRHITNRKNAPAQRGPRNAYTGRPEINFTACRADQTAKEKDGHGYFTTAATRILRAGVEGLSHAEFLKKVRTDFPLPASSQEPQLSCDDSFLNGFLFQAPAVKPARAAGPDTPSGPSIPCVPGACPAEAKMLIQALADAMHSLRRLIG